MPLAHGTPSDRVVFYMNELEQLVSDVQGFAVEVRRLGYSSAGGGHENRFLELSDRMVRRAEDLRRRGH
jgi:hypothetical protein